jgi:hypothetical protein
MSEQDRRIWDGLSIDTRTLLSKVLQNAYTGGSGNRVILVDADGNIVTSLGGGGGGGGGKSTYSTAQGDITAVVVPGTKTFAITLGRFPTVISEDHIISANFCKVQDATTGLISDVSLSPVSVSGNVVTVTDQINNFATGDTIILKLEGPLKQDDAALDVQKVIVYNADYAHRTDPENWSLTDVTGLQRRIIDMDTYKYFNFQYVYSQTGSQTGTMKVYKSNVPSADITSLTNWVEDSTGVLGAGSIVFAGTGTSENFIEVTGPTSPLKYMLEIDVTAAGTGVDVASDVYIRKFY